MNKKRLFIAAGIIGVIIVAVIVFFVIQSANTPRTDLIQVSSSQEVVTCPMETKICPDGNIVVRDSTNGCAFYDCPVDPTNTSAAPVSNSTSTTSACTQEVKMCPDGSTQVGRESSRNCQFKICPDGTQLQ